MPTLAELQPQIRERARRISRRSGYRLDVDDLTQEGMIAAARVLERQADAELAIVAAWRMMIDVGRRESRCGKTQEAQIACRTVELTEAHDPVDPAPGPEECAMWRQLARLVVAAIEQLPLQHRLAIGVDVTEPGEREDLARKLGVHPSRVSQLRAAAVGMLRAQLAA